MATETTLKALANLVKLLPTGTVFLFMFLNTLISNNGTCDTTEKTLMIILIAVCGFLCVFSSFTDSYKEDSVTQYGIVTTSGRLWPHAEVSDDYKLKVGDFAHALLSLIVLGVLVLFDPNTLNCLYPSLDTSSFLKWLPVVAGIISTISAWFPNMRHGIGYHHNSNSSDYTLLK
ncbi:protein DMP2-like [Pistacia vera]|uniref:protein DMP2-like n=1 Tax=Pistacia vera TaxID=55513 RepID=UPI001262B855|nr:protein DMP2-like [Pistacia vera]